MKIWEEYRGKGGRDALIQYYLPVVRDMAHKMEMDFPGLATQDDLLGSGIFGLLKSRREFDTQAGVDFNKFCRENIYEAMKEEIADVYGIPRLIWNKLANRETLVVGLREHENMTFGEIAELVDRDEEEIIKVYAGVGVKLGRREPYTI